MLKKDIMELCILHALAEQEIYGYALLRRLGENFQGMQDSALYALLRGLCKSGCTETYQGTVSDGPARKYYRLTEAGRERLARLTEEWQTLKRAMQAFGIE